MKKKYLRRLVYIFICVVTVVALFYAIEDWRGSRAWRKYQRERETIGDRFEWSAIAPPSVPDDQNFAATPLFAELFPKPPPHPRSEALRLPDSARYTGSWRDGRVEDLAVWRKSFTNDNLLAALTPYEPILHEVDEAGHRPACRFPIRYEDHVNALLPHLTPLRHAARLYRLRALASLDASQSDAALADVRMCLRLADTIKDEPLLISFLVRVSILDIAIQPVWEGLVAHRWNDRQLTELQSEFGKIDQFACLAGAYKGERMFAYSVTRWLREDPRRLTMMLGNPEIQPLRWIAVFSPSGWLWQNELRMDRYYTECLLPAFEFDHRRVNPSAVERADRSVQTQPVQPYNVLLKMITSAENVVARKGAMSQTAVALTVTACALERFRLAHGVLPENLEALVPQFLAQPLRDVIDGHPLLYKRIAADQFMLYSIGWNETDDGGQIAWQSGGMPRLRDDTKGDWVWSSQPATVK